MTTAFFVAADWLAEHIDDPQIQIIDARMAPPGQEDRDVAQEYRSGHIPGAVFFDIEALSDHTSPLPHMMPRPESFAVAMRELGVHQDKHLIVYDEGNLFSAPRAWWMLRTFGVENVSILGGGLAGWQRDELPLQEGNVELPEGLMQCLPLKPSCASPTSCSPAMRKAHRLSMPARQHVLMLKSTSRVQVSDAVIYPAP